MRERRRGLSPLQERQPELKPPRQVVRRQVDGLLQMRNGQVDAPLLGQQTSEFHSRPGIRGVEFRKPGQRCGGLSGPAGLHLRERQVAVRQQVRRILLRCGTQKAHCRLESAGLNREQAPAQQRAATHRESRHSLDQPVVQGNSRLAGQTQMALGGLHAPQVAVGEAQGVMGLACVRHQFDHLLEKRRRRGEVSAVEGDPAETQKGGRLFRFRLQSPVPQALGGLEAAEPAFHLGQPEECHGHAGATIERFTVTVRRLRQFTLRLQGEGLEIGPAPVQVVDPARFPVANERVLEHRQRFRLQELQAVVQPPQFAHRFRQFRRRRALRFEAPYPPLETVELTLQRAVRDRVPERREIHRRPGVPPAGGKQPGHRQ